jgi:ABC-2 type transport system permease protein
MTRATLDSHPGAPGPDGRLRLTHRLDLSAAIALFRATVAQLVRGRRLLVIGLLFALPAVVAILARVYNPDYRADQVEEALVFYLIPHALVPLSALLFTAGMIQDEVEDQTLTYLLIRPFPRWAIYATKLFATLAVAIALTAVFTTVTLGAIHWGEDEFWTTVLASRAPRIAALLALSLWAYGSIFGLLGLFLRRSLVAGVAYVIVFEGVFANIDFIVRKLTVMWYFRVLAERWLDLRISSWSINLDDAPDARDCVVRLLLAGTVATVIAALAFSVREYRVKTPEGS